MNAVSSTPVTVPGDSDPVTDDELRAVEAACRVLVSISARSLAAVVGTVDPAQFRALVVLSNRGSVSLGELAEACAIHLSTASRMCERLVSTGLIDRADDPDNRRQLVLTLTAAGRRLVRDVMRRRRAALAPMVQGLPKEQRRQLVELLRLFAQADGEPTEQHLLFMGRPN